MKKVEPTRYQRLLLGLFTAALLVACESPAGQTISKVTQVDSPPGVDRGTSSLLVSISKSIYPFEVDLSGYVPTSKGEFVIPKSGKSLFNQNILLVPLFGQASDKYMYTKYGGKLEDPIGYFGQLAQEKIASPFDVPLIEYTIEALDEVEVTYYVIDGQIALDEFQKQVGLVPSSSDPKKLSYLPQLANIPFLKVADNEVTLICLLKQKVFHITRKSDVYSQDFTSRRQLIGEKSAAAFYDDYGDTMCSSMDLGGYVFLRQNYYYKDSPYTLLEIRTALAEYASSFFNTTGVKQVGEKTSKVMQSIQETLPYQLANSGAGLTIPSFPTTSQFPQVLADFTMKMKNGDNLWTTDLTYAKY